MSPISSRKHAAHRQPRQFASPALAFAALALPCAVHAQSAPAAPASAASQAARAEPTLPAVKVQAAKENDYKADTVSSSKFSEPLLDTPQTITVIKKELVQQQGGTTLTEALRNTPGVGTFYVGENGSTSTGDAVYMRGFDASGSIFVDGIRDVGSISRDVFNLDQIEVEKGPAGTDNGHGSPTGSINLVSKHAELGNSASGSLTAGNEHQRRATADINRQLGDGVAARISLMDQDSAAPGRDRVKNKRWAFAPTVSVGLGAPTTATLSLLHMTQHNVPDGGVPTIGLPGYTNTNTYLNGGAKVDPRNFYGTTSDYDDVAVDMATLQVQHKFGAHGVLRNTTRLGETVEDYLLTSFMTLTATGADPATWTVARSNPTNKHQINVIMANQTTLTNEVQLAGVKHALSAGFELIGEAQRTRGIATSSSWPAATGSWPAASLYAPDPNVTGYTRTLDADHTEGKTGTVAAYAFDTLHFGERFLLTGGLRLDHYRTHYESNVACGGTATACATGVASGTLVQPTNLDTSGILFGWKLGGIYKPSADASLYANYAVSQQPPGGTNFALSSSANSASNPNMDPQKAKTMEIGAKWNLMDGDLGLTGALYRTDILNDIESDGGTPVQYLQTGKKRVQGVELSAVGNITRDWAVNAGFTTMITQVLSGAVVGNDGSDALNYTPRKAFTSWTSYKLPLGFSVGGGMRYNGKLQRGKDSAVGTPKYVNDYWVADGMLAWEYSRQLDFRLNVYNLADRDYVAAINKSGYRYTPGAPRYFTLSANVQF